MVEPIIDKRKQQYAVQYSLSKTTSSKVSKPLDFDEWKGSGLKLTYLQFGQFKGPRFQKEFISIKEIPREGIFGALRGKQIEIKILINDADQLKLITKLKNLQFCSDFQTFYGGKKSENISNNLFAYVDVGGLDEDDLAAVKKWFLDNKEKWIKESYKYDKQMLLHRGVTYDKSYNDKADVLLLDDKSEKTRFTINGQISVCFSIDKIPIKIEIKGASKLISDALNCPVEKIKKLLSTEENNVSVSTYFDQINKATGYPNRALLPNTVGEC